MGRLNQLICLCIVGGGLLACQSQPAESQADVIVVGAGIAGLSAALEASENGGHVIVLEASSVAGGHAVQAGGFALVGTPLQARKGYTDSPELAYRDLMKWGVDADADWVRLFTERASTDIHDWLTSLGVKFNILLDTPEDSVPRFHFAGGTAINVVVPMMREAFARGNIQFVMNTRVEDLIDADQAIGVRHSHLRTGGQETIYAPTVILATGGFQSNMDIVRANWPTDLGVPERLLIGSGHNALGDGIALGQDLDGSLSRMHNQVTFINGLPNPRNPERGLHVTNTAAIWVDSNGSRFVNEAADSKQTEAAGLALLPQTHWLIFDAKGRRKLRLRGAPWLNPKTIAEEILDDQRTTNIADSINGLAAATGLPVAALNQTIQRYNEFVAQGRDDDFQRLAAATGQVINEPPFYAMQLFPMTRKSLGGLAIDLQSRVLNTMGEPVPGLFAAGELTGVAGINGSHGGSGTFLAPSVLTGRIAGANAAAFAQSSGLTEHLQLDNGKPDTVTPAAAPVTTAPMQTRQQLEARLALDQPGYWHFKQSHDVVVAQNYDCERCHSGAWPTMPAISPTQRTLQLTSCTTCH